MISFASAKAPEQIRTAENKYSELVERIRRGEESGIEELYGMLSRGLNILIRKQLRAQDVDDTVQDTILAIVQGIQKHGLRNPECLMGYARKVMQCQIAERINKLCVVRSRDVGLRFASEAVDPSTPEQWVIRHQNAGIMHTILNSLPPQHREVLTRFYVLEQTAEQIMQEMGLTATQFRLMKSRAKARFGLYGRSKLNRPTPIQRSLNRAPDDRQHWQTLDHTASCIQAFSACERREQLP